MEPLKLSLCPSHFTAVAHQQIQQPELSTSSESSSGSSSQSWKSIKTTLICELVLERSILSKSLKGINFLPIWDQTPGGKAFSIWRNRSGERNTFFWREKYIFMEHRIKLYHRAAKIKSSIETKISQFYFPTSVYSCRELRDSLQFWISNFCYLGSK